MATRKGTPGRLRLQMPAQETSISHFLTASGTFRDGDLIVNRNGLRVVSQEQPAVSHSQDAAFTLEDLETVKVLGKGSGGVVQLTCHKWTGQFFAVKVIQMNIEETVRKQIVRELRINQAMHCPFVVVCYHAFYNNGVISIVLEYMDGGSLADVLKSCRTIPEQLLAVICKQVLKGLIYLHQDRHVIHRDLKPSNLLVNHKGEVKITDFGVSAVLTSSMGQRNTFIGTYKYMSPERVSGHTHSYDSDVWSLGLVMLECALGYFPYLAPVQNEGWLNFYELLDAIVNQPPPLASRDQFSPEFCSFISGCLQKEPTYRISAVELLKHPFLVKYENQSTDDLARFINYWLPIELKN
eukprot:c29704_g1_i1 orf=387-1445(-)